MVRVEKLFTAVELVSIENAPSARFARHGRKLESGKLALMGNRNNSVFSPILNTFISTMFGNPNSLLVDLWEERYIFPGKLKMRNIYFKEPWRTLENTLTLNFRPACMWTICNSRVRMIHSRMKNDTWILQFFIASEIYFYWYQILRLLAPASVISLK